MRDDDERAVVADQELAQPVDRVEVQVVRRLVEQQRVGMAEERLRQQHAHFLAALQLGHRALVQLARDVESLQQHGRVALRRVAVLLADDALELAEAHAVLVGERRPWRRDCSRAWSVCHSRWLPMITVSIDAERVERELVLPQHAELVRPRDRALLRQRLAGQQLHERRLAGAVRPRQPVAASPGERGGHVLEEQLRAEPHRHVLHGNHLPPHWRRTELTIVTGNPSGSCTRAVHFVYIVRCRDGSFYIGYARDARARVRVHNSGRGARYTSGRRPVRLVSSEACETQSHALKREITTEAVAAQEEAGAGPKTTPGVVNPVALTTPGVVL